MSFTLGHGLAASLALHGALILPFVVVLDPPPPQDSQLLVVELQGLVSDTQSEQQVLQQTRGAPDQKQQDEAQEEQKTQTAQAASPDRPPEDQTPDGTLASAPPPSPEQQAQDAPPQESAKPTDAQSGTPGLADVQGAQEQKQAQTVAPEVDEAQILRAYVRSLTKKLKDNIVYPPDAQRSIRRKGTAYVSFAVEADGSLRPGTLRIERSSGTPAYDVAALRTVEKNAPFDAPPRPMRVGVPVDYFPN
ncbi:TonB family protein [Xanthobacter autotrophicus]|uniref:TonB family protein n=1 Tax=Xanthobacter autotrophicus TaxID=280 RepID=UPI0037287A35